MSAETVHSPEPDDSDEGVEVNVSTVRAHLPDYLDRVKDGEIIYLTNRGKRLGVALVPDEVAERGEQEEDEYWAARAREAEESGTVSWREALAYLEGGR